MALTANSSNECKDTQESESQSSDAICEYKDAVVKGSNPWLNCEERKVYNMKWGKRLNTEFYFTNLLASIDKDKDKTTTEWKDTISIYSSLKWLPKTTVDDHCKQTQVTLDAWQKENPKIECEWNLLNRKTAAYQCVRKDRNYVIMVDVVWSTHWFREMGLNVKRKLYFWRGTYDNNQNGKQQAKKHARLMVDRLNLCYCAWRKAITAKPKRIHITDIPVIVFMEPIKDYPCSPSKYPKWIFIVEDKLNNNDPSNNNHDNVKSKGSFVCDESGVRKSLRLAEKQIASLRQQGSNNKTTDK